MLLQNHRPSNAENARCVENISVTPDAKEDATELNYSIQKDPTPCYNGTIRF